MTNPSQDPEQSWTEQLAVEVLDKVVFNDWLDNIKDPDVLEHIISKRNKNASDYLTANGEIDLDMLRRDLTITDRISLMISNWVGDFASDKIEEMVPDLEITTRTFAEAAAELDDSDGPIYSVGNNNLVLPSTSPLQQIGSYWDLLRSASGNHYL